MSGTEKKELRDYQEKIVKVLKGMEAEFKSFSTIVDLPTGSGKTLIAAEYVLNHVLRDGNKVLWLAHRNFLLEQAATEIAGANKEIGVSYTSIIISGSNDKMEAMTGDEDIVFGTIYSMKYEGKLETWVESAKKLYIIIDEVHHVCSHIYDSFLDKLLVGEKGKKEYALIGLTATPFRMGYDEINLFKWFKMGYVEPYKKGNRDLNGKFTQVDGELGKYGETSDGGFVSIKNKGNKIKVITLEDLINIKILYEPEFIRVDDFNYIDRQNNTDIISQVAQNIINSKGMLGKTAIFVSKVEEAKKLKEALDSSDLGYYIEALTGKVKGDNREEIINAFNENENAILISVDVISEGFNVEDLNTVILIAPTHSDRLLRQRIGRVVRKSNEKKECRVIWYYYPKNDFDDLSQKVGNNILNNSGYDLKTVQSSASLDADITRQTYYLAAPEYKKDIDYQTKYDPKTSINYLVLLEIIDLFKGNDELKNYTGYYDFNGIMIHTNDLLDEGIRQLRQRIEVEWSILRYNNTAISVNDIWGTKKDDYLEDVMETCFFLCKPSRKSVFYINKDEIEEIIKYLVSHNCALPDPVKLQGNLIQLVKNLIEENPQITKEEIEANENYKELEEKFDDKELLRTMLEKCIDDFSNAPIEKYKETDAVKLIRSLIAEKSIEQPLTIRKHDYTLRLQNGAFDAHLDSVFKSMQSGANWRNSYVMGTCSHCGQSVPIISMEFSSTEGHCRICNDKNEHKLMHAFTTSNNSYYTVEAYAQSLIKNMHHIVVTSADIEEYKSALVNGLAKRGIKVVDADSLVKDTICALAVSKFGRGNLTNWRVTLKDLIKICDEIPKFLGYLLYDEIYEELSENVSDISDKTDLEKLANKYLNEYNLTLKQLKLHPVEDFIFDNKEYFKVLQYYQGIKTDMLCKMVNFILHQATGYDSVLSGCGGSGAGLLNISDDSPAKTRYYNEYGYPLTTFYKVIKDRRTLTELERKIDRFVNFIIDPDSDSDFDNDFIKCLKGHGENNTSLERIGEDYRNKNEIPDSHYERFDVSCIDGVKGRENRLYGVFQNCSKAYNWMIGVDKDDEIDIDDIDIAFITFVHWSFNDRYAFNDCYIRNFAKFAAKYKSYLETGHAKLADWKINTQKSLGNGNNERDVNKVLRGTVNFVENRDRCITYCDM